MSNPLTGTTAPLFIPRTPDPQAIVVGQNYFFIQIHNAQAAYFGPPWKQTEGLAVVSQVNLSHEVFGDTLRALRRTRKVERNRAEQLGLSPNLIDLVPASMNRVTVSIDFILDRKNQLAALSKIINTDGLLSAISLAPGAALVAQTLSKVSQQLIESFIPAEDSLPLLQFSSDFNLAGEGLREGYYVILGSRDDGNPLPSPYVKLSVRDRVLLANDQAVTQLSYIILNVQCVPVRTRDGSQGAAWDLKLREAEAQAQNLLDNPLATAGERRQGWEACVRLLTEARTLILADPAYLRDEANAIIKSVYHRCNRLVSQDIRVRGEGAKAAWTPDEGAARAWLQIPPEEDLTASLGRYADQVAAARRVLKSAGLR